MKIVANNKQASHLYFLEDRYEAGIVLRGTEIKAIRSGKVSIQDSFVRIKNHEAYVLNMHIAKYDHGNTFNHDETRERKLLLHKKEIIKIADKVARENYTLVPTKIYLKEGLCKLEFALAKGKKLYDKRQSLKEKDMKKRMDKELNRRG
ncbi:SsrA-binding protein SmpB [Liberiplasma polymorphum]|uniref:SsrA-binding protein SmpB n=1 Tax=Liberiplasma polymorphum TaxID=3374570 RepID=UPI003774C8A2